MHLNELTQCGLLNHLSRQSGLVKTILNNNYTPLIKLPELQQIVPLSLMPLDYWNPNTHFSCCLFKSQVLLNEGLLLDRISHDTEVSGYYSGFYVGGAYYVLFELIRECSRLFQHFLHSFWLAKVAGENGNHLSHDCVKTNLWSEMLLALKPFSLSFSRTLSFRASDSSRVSFK